MKPSERIMQLCKKVCASHGKHQPRTKDIDDALPYAIVEYLDERYQEYLDEEAAARVPRGMPEPGAK